MHQALKVIEHLNIAYILPKALVILARRPGWHGQRALLRSCDGSNNNVTSAIINWRSATAGALETSRAPHYYCDFALQHAPRGQPLPTKRAARRFSRSRFERRLSAARLHLTKTTRSLLPLPSPIAAASPAPLLHSPPANSTNAPDLAMPLTSLTTTRP